MSTCEKLRFNASIMRKATLAVLFQCVHVKFRAVAQLVSVHDWGSWGRRFKSAQPEFLIHYRYGGYRATLEYNNRNNLSRVPHRVPGWGKTEGSQWR